MVAQTTLPLSAFTEWLAFGERGLSSEAIVSHLTGVSVGRSWGGDERTRLDHPLDPSDFRRCEKLLIAVPLARLCFPQMHTASPQWSRLVAAWDDIRAAIVADAPEWMQGKGSAPNGYRLMRRIVVNGQTCSDCEGTGHARPCEKCKGTGRRGGGVCRAREPFCERGFVTCEPCRGRGYIGGDY